MRRTALALFVVLAACSVGRDRYLPRFGERQTLTETNGPVAFAVAPDDRVYYAELRTNTVRVEGVALFTTPHRPDSLAVDDSANIYVATRTKKHRVRVFRNEELLWDGPVSRFPAHLAITADGEVVVGLGDDVLELATRRVVSSGWTDPVVTAGRGNRIWVADNALPGEKERVARGRERSVAKRNRFASALPPYTNPTGMALLDDQLLVCSRTHKKVYRLHIGLDDVARRRAYLKGVLCDRNVAVDRAEGLITATPGFIYRYPRR